MLALFIKKITNKPVCVYSWWHKQIEKNYSKWLLNTVIWLHVPNESYSDDKT